MSEPLVILVTGGTGAGKTTYARTLAENIGGVRFSIDDWTTELFWMDAPSPPDFNWIMARIARCETRIRSMASEVLSRGLPVVLDLGFTKSEHRRSFIDWADAQGYPARIDHVQLPAQTRWVRVQGRNTERGNTFAMEVTREMFDFMESEWEPVTEDESKIVIV